MPTGSDRPSYPYLVYEMQQGGFDAENDIALAFSIIDKNDSFIPCYNIADNIAQAIGNGKIIELDDGYVKIAQGSPWADNQRDPEDNTIRRLYSIIWVTYYTNH